MGRTYFTGVLPITLDDLSSGFNVGTVVNLSPELLGMVGFTQDQVERYVDEIYADRGFDRANYQDVLADLKAFYDGYRFLPGAEPLYNATICNWYLFNLVGNGGAQPDLVIDANVRTDVGWIRRLAGGGANALARVRAYVERGEGEAASRSGLAAKFGRIKFDFEAAFPYYLYYLSPIACGSHSGLMAIDCIKGFCYRDLLPRRPGWKHPVETYVVEVCGNRGYNWFAIA